MKNSGIEWIGDIPEEWDCCPIKRAFSVVSGATPKSENTEYWDGDILWVTPADYKTNQKYVCGGKRNLTEEGYASCGTTLVPKGAIIFSKRAPIGTVAIAAEELCTNQGCLSCIPSQIADTVFFYYTMSVFIEQFNLFGTGTTFKEISYTDFVNFSLPLPPLPEQRCIADYLDRKCAEIDAAAEATRRSIEEYKALRQSLITEAVTRGVRGKRPLKDSGVEWIGEIPEEWTIGRLQFLITYIESGTSVNAGQQAASDSELGVLKTSCVSKNVFLPEENKAVNLEEYSRVTCPVCANTLIVSRMNTPDLVGAAGFVERDFPNIFLPDRLWQVHFISEVYVKFYYYWVTCSCVRNYYSSLAVGTSSSMQNISQDQFYHASCPLLPLAEQQEIADYLDTRCAEIDRLIAAKEQLLTELESYKKSVIYETVTGKKEVPTE